MDIWIWIYGYRILNLILGLEVDSEFKMGYVDPGLFWARANLDWGPLGSGDPDPGTQTQGPRLGDPDPDLETQHFCPQTVRYERRGPYFCCSNSV